MGDGPEPNSSTAGSEQAVPKAEAMPMSRGPQMPQNRELAGVLRKEEERSLEEALASKKEPSKLPPGPRQPADGQQSMLVEAL